MIYVREGIAYVLSQKFCGVMSYIEVFKPFQIYFCIWCDGVF